MGCRYASKKKYKYWAQAKRLNTLCFDKLFVEGGCPFGGARWQLWVNHTLVQAEAHKRGMNHGVFAVCASENNDELIKESVLEKFSELLTDDTTFVFISLEKLLAALPETNPSATFDWGKWLKGVRDRYFVR